jgi:hypothetical protein
MADGAGSLGSIYPDRGLVAGTVPGVAGLSGGAETRRLFAGDQHPLGTDGSATPMDGQGLREITEPSPRRDDESWGIQLARHDKELWGQEKKHDEVKQGAILNCPLPALLAALIHTRKLDTYIKITARAAKVKSRYKDLSAYPESNKKENPPLAKNETQTTFEIAFPGDAKTEVTNFLWSNSGGAAEYGRSSSDVLWVSVIEKAFVVLKCGASFETLASADKGPSANDVVEFVTGSVQVKETAKLGASELTATLTAATTVPTIARRGNIDNNLAHAYAVLGLSAGKVKLYDALGQRDREITLDAFKKDYDYIFHP